MAISIDNFKPIGMKYVNLPNTVRKTFRTNYVTTFMFFPAMKFIERFCLVLYWNKKSPDDSIVELRAIRQYSCYGETEPIDPKLLRFVMEDDKEFCNAIVDIEPGRSFIKGLSGGFVVNLDTYRDRAGDTFIGSVLFDHAKELAIALTFPWKIKGLFNARKALGLIEKVEEFVKETQGEGKFSSEIRTTKKLVNDLKDKVEDVDADIRSDHETFTRSADVLRQFGIEYDMNEDCPERD
jgi:hypothetical protein